jgi:hypothetical protein
MIRDLKKILIQMNEPNEISLVPFDMVHPLYWIWKAPNTSLKDLYSFLHKLRPEHARFDIFINGQYISEKDYVMEKVKEVVDGDGEFDESDIDDIFSYDGNIRQFRGSIYIDGVVPETEDKEFDRKAAMKVMEFFAKKTDANQYVGGVGFKRRDITNPFDKDF